MRKLSRKILSALLALALLASVLPLGAAPAQAADSGYSFDAATGTLTITDASVLDNIEFNQGDIDLSKMEHLVITADNASIQTSHLGTMHC